MAIIAGVQTVRMRLALRVTAVVVMAASLAVPGPAMAVAPPATLPGSVTGVHYLIDNQMSPGVRCIYPDTRYSSPLLRMVIRPPVVFGADRRDNRIDRQRVGWRYVIQGGAADGQFAATGRSPIHTAFATDHAPAVFRSLRWRAHAANYRMRIVIKVFWYRDGQIVGRTSLVPRYYGYEPMGETFKGGCNG